MTPLSSFSSVTFIYEATGSLNVYRGNIRDLSPGLPSTLNDIDGPLTGRDVTDYFLGTDAVFAP
jgi:hypothetical protein